MKILYSFAIFCLLFSCQEKQNQTIVVSKPTVSNDSVVLLIDAKWKFSTPSYSTKNHAVMSNWDEWRQLLLLLESKPAQSIHAYKAKIEEVYKQVELLENSIPEGYNNKAVLSRINLLKTHSSQLDMYMELTHLPHKELTNLIGLMQKDIVSIVLQFEEVHTKKSIPKEENEPTKIIVDTDRKATLNAWE